MSDDPLEISALRYAFVAFRRKFGEAMSTLDISRASSTRRSICFLSFFQGVSQIWFNPTSKNTHFLPSLMQVLRTSQRKLWRRMYRSPNRSFSERAPSLSPSVFFHSSFSFSPTPFSDDGVKKIFGRYGRIVDITLPLDYHTRDARGFGFVEYKDGRNVNKYKRDRRRRIFSGVL